MSTPIKLAIAVALFCGLMIALPGSSQAGLLHCAPHCPPPPPPQNVVLVVCHPCTCCDLQIPVCVPACCQGAPSICFQRTVIGPGKAVFTWSCGHQVVVRFTRNGGYRVVRA
jgi:hypothetical protein